jgi:soluble cytochrome b562
MGLDFSCFGNTTTNCDIISFGNTKPELEIDTEIFPIEQPEIKIQDPVVIKDTFQAAPKIPPTPNVFTQSSTIDWTNVTWEVSNISADALEIDTSYSKKLIKDDAPLKLIFEKSDKSFTGIFNPDKFKGYVIDDDKWSYNELKDFEKKLTDLKAKGQLTDEQIKGLESLRQETSQIEAQASRFTESGLNTDPNSIIDLRLKNGGQGFYDDLTKLSKTVKEQEAINSTAEIASKNSYVKEVLTNRSAAEKRIYKLANKILEDKYSSEKDRKEDREKFFELYHQLDKAKQDGLEAGGVIDQIMKNEKTLKALKEGYGKDTKEFLNRLEELQELENSGNISATEKETLIKMKQEKETILRLQEKLKDNPEEAYRLHKEITLAFARAGNYEKAAAMSNGESTALDRSEAMNRAATTDKEKKAAKIYTNILVSDPILRERNQVDSKELDSWIKLKGGLDKSTYPQDYASSSTSYSNDKKSEIHPGSPEFYSLSQAEKDAIRRNTLNTKIAEKDAVKELISWGVPENIAIAIVTNNTSLLKEKALDVSFETASQYLKLAGLNTTRQNPETKGGNFFNLSIS